MYEVINLVMAAGHEGHDARARRGPARVPARRRRRRRRAARGDDRAGARARRTVIIPATSSVLCAFGMLLADLRHDYVQAHRTLWSAFDPGAARGAARRDASPQGMAALDREGVEEPRRRSRVPAPTCATSASTTRSPSPFPLAELGAGDGWPRIERPSTRRHEQLYGFSVARAGRWRSSRCTRSVLGGTRGARPAAARPQRAGRRRRSAAPRRAWLPTAASRPRRSPVHDGRPPRRGAGDPPGRRSSSGATTTVLVPEAFDLDGRRARQLRPHAS